MAFVTPAQVKQYQFAQSRHAQLPEVPFRAIIAAPSGAGKTVLLRSMVLDLYKTKGGGSPFSRVYIFSPSVNVDPAWTPVKEFIVEELGVDEKRETFCFESYVPGELAEVIETKRKSSRPRKRAATRDSSRSS